MVFFMFNLLGLRKYGRFNCRQVCIRIIFICSLWNKFHKCTLFAKSSYHSCISSVSNSFNSRLMITKFPFGVRFLRPTPIGKTANICQASFSLRQRFSSRAFLESVIRHGPGTTESFSPIRRKLFLRLFLN